MKSFTYIFITIILLFSCNNNDNKNLSKNHTTTRIIFLHHSTGENIWKGGYFSGKTFFQKILKRSSKNEAVPKWFSQYNTDHHSDYLITDQYFPKTKPYGWKNYPFDYYNIWVKHAGEEPYLEEPTLEILTKKYDVIIWKHCFPVSGILPDSTVPDIDSDIKTLGNYKLQYEALKRKMHEFPNVKFIVWTGAALVQAATTEENAKRAKKFFDWVRNEWDEPGDNIYLWDFYQLETDGGLYMKKEYASGTTDSHPNPSFSQKVYPLFCQRIVDIIETGGENTTLTGE